MNSITLKQVNGNTRSIELDEVMAGHFADNNKNHGHTIVNQINEQHFYDHYFKDKKDLVVLDIGANIGLFSIHVAPACKTLIACEPTPSHFAKLKHLTAGISNIDRRQIALAGHSGKVNFNLDGANTTMNSLIVHVTKESIQVECLTLYDILRKEMLDHVDFCKIDIEGSEMIALTFENVKAVYEKIDAFFVEVHPTYSLDGMNQQQNKEKLWGIFASVGYKVDDINFETFYAHK